MKRFLTVLSASLALLVWTSCERLFFSDAVSATPSEVFEYLWRKVDTQYALFDVKDVDWNAVHDEYAPMVSDSMDDEELFGVLEGMLECLEDGHVNVTSSFNVSRSDTVSYYKYSDNQLDIRTLVLNYIGLDYHSTGAFIHNWLSKGRVAYLRYSSFMNAVSDKDMEYISSYYDNAMGFILDLRQNGGGEIENIWRMLRWFPGEGQLMMSTRIKSGPGHNDFSAPENVYAHKDSSGVTPITKPVVLLVDRGSYSAASIFTLCAKSFSNVTVVGDYTGGGLGLPNGGELPNGWVYRFPITRTLAPDGVNYENGVPPDIRVALDRDLLQQGRDNVLEYACLLITGKEEPTFDNI